MAQMNMVISLLVLATLIHTQIGHTSGVEVRNTEGNVTMVGMDNETERTPHTIHVAQINFEEVKIPFLICVVVLLAALSKMVFHHIKFLASMVPESCLLIVIGVIIGAIIHFSELSAHFPDFFTPHEFFLYLLPPIILEAAFSLHSRVVFNNLGAILTFAVMGTVLACFAVGYTMYGLHKVGAMGDIELGVVEILIFSSLIVAVDPVAVLAVFEEIGVNNVLYFMVFGESLLNDGVTVVLYNVMHEINAMDHVDATQIVLGVVTFLVVAGGGALVGVVIGLISAIVTKYTNSARVVEPIAVFIFAYMSFIVADIFTLSGIISMIACGVVQMKYTFRNISPKSSSTIKYFTKVLSTATEIVIFLFLGLSLVSANHNFQVGFILWAIFLTLIYRFIITFGLSFLLNKDRYRVRKITLQEQFIISYGGLRGAVAFSLVGLLEKNDVHSRELFVTATLAVIIFTVFIQGITIKPLVKLFKVRMAPKEKANLFEEIMTQMTDNIMSGMETIMGYRGNHQLKAILEFYEDKYLKNWLLRKPDEDEEIMRSYQKVVLRDHLKNLYASGAQIPRSPAVVRALSGSDSNGMFPTEDDSQTTITENGDVEIEMEPVIRRETSKVEGRTDSMTSWDMVNLLATRGRDSIRKSSDAEQTLGAKPDLLHHLKYKHLRVTQLQKQLLHPSEGAAFERNLSWHGARRRNKSAEPTVTQRPASALLGPSDFNTDRDSAEHITTDITASALVRPYGPEPSTDASTIPQSPELQSTDPSSTNVDQKGIEMRNVGFADMDSTNHVPSSGGSAHSDSRGIDSIVPESSGRKTINSQSEDIESSHL